MTKWVSEAWCSYLITFANLEVVRKSDGCEYHMITCLNLFFVMPNNFQTKHFNILPSEPWLTFAAESLNLLHQQVYFMRDIHNAEEGEKYKMQTD